LNAVKADCEAKGADVFSKLIDVSDESAMKDWISECATLDLVIANAGVSTGIKADDDLAPHIKKHSI